MNASLPKSRNTRCIIFGPNQCWFAWRARCGILSHWTNRYLANPLCGQPHLGQPFIFVETKSQEKWTSRELLICLDKIVWTDILNSQVHKLSGPAKLCHWDEWKGEKLVHCRRELHGNVKISCQSWQSRKSKQMCVRRTTQPLCESSSPEGPPTRSWGPEGPLDF